MRFIVAVRGACMLSPPLLCRRCSLQRRSCLFLHKAVVAIVTPGITPSLYGSLM
jgi:hypothetical protein